MNDKFIKFVEQQLKIINYSELVPDFSFVINLLLNSFHDKRSMLKVLCHIRLATELDDF